MTTKRVNDLDFKDVGKRVLIDLEDGGVEGIITEITPWWDSSLNSLWETVYFLDSVDIRLKGGLLIEGLSPSQEITFPSTM